ncbi:MULTISPECIES: FCD domain-containing protein [Polymorphospora]|uniref:FCD domain-containing protein n=1 Tax=Polymorphospora lycopeni TaxID=3140240 RepID=A0ABV5CMN3_9ACTN
MTRNGGNTKLASVIAREIVKDIVRRRLGAGAALPSESAMLEQFGVGRASLREALRILEVHGLLTIRPGPGGGPVVQTVSSQHFGQMATLYFHVAGATFRELAEARLVLEPVIARQAALRGDPDTLAALNTVVEQAREHPVGDSRAQFEAGTDFHAVLAGASGNRVLDLVSRAIGNIYAERITGVVFPLEARARVVEAHADIVAAITAGDAELAERLTREHMTEFIAQAEKRYPGFLDEIVDWH